MAEMPGLEGGPEYADERPARRPVGPRVVGLLIIAAAAAVLVVQNSQRVTVRFWFVTSHVRLIWVMIGCLVVAFGFGYVVGHRRGRRRRRRR